MRYFVILTMLPLFAFAIRGMHDAEPAASVAPGIGGPAAAAAQSAASGQPSQFPGPDVAAVAPEPAPSDSAVNAQQDSAASLMPIEIGQTVSADDWIAAGLCNPMPVTLETLRLAFDPRLAAATEPGSSPPQVVTDGEHLQLGEYRVALDRAARQLTVSGPTGAEVLQRDIERCIGLTDPRAITEAGRWRWSTTDSAWRYVDEPLDRSAPPAAASDPSQ